MPDLTIPSAFADGAYRYRTVKLGDRGADVFALQTAILPPADNLDGAFGPHTEERLKRAQVIVGVEADGLAGPMTQQALAVRLGVVARKEHKLPIGALYGQLKQESGFLLGNSSAPRPDGSRDRGVAQMNDALHKPIDAYNVPYSIDLLAKWIRDHYVKFAGLGEDRRWDLAQGAWNAPAYASFYARKEGATGVPTSDTRDPSRDGEKAVAKFATYIEKVTLYRR